MRKLSEPVLSTQQWSTPVGVRKLSEPVLSTQQWSTPVGVRKLPLANLILAAALALPTACTPDFEKVWQVLDLRILAIQADPAEVMLPNRNSTTIPPVQIRALVADPRLSADEVLEWEIWACTPEEKLCDDAARRVQVARRRTTLDRIEATFQLQPDLLQAAISRDQYRGFGGVPIKVQLNVWPKGESQAIRATKRLVYGFDDDTPLLLPAQTATLSGPCRGAPPLCNDGLTCDASAICRKTPNQNPTVTQVEADDKPVPPDWTVTLNTKIMLLPDTPKADAEPYWVFNFEGGTQPLKEYLSYTYFVTSGKLSDANTGGKPSPFVENKKVADISSDWTPQEAGPATIWVVVRDDRGGTGWFSVAATAALAK